MEPSYELFYSCGGHCGPCWTLEEAIQAARNKLNGMPTMSYINIVCRDPLSIGGYGKTALVISQTDPIAS